MPLDEVLPPPVAHGDLQLGRVHDVREQHGRKDAVKSLRRPLYPDEPADGLQPLIERLLGALVEGRDHRDVDVR